MPCWYPVYTDYPYYDNVASPVAYDNGYDTGYGNSAPVEAASTADSAAVPSAPSYGDLGTAWGQDLRRDIVTWDQFVAYVRAYIIIAAPAAQADFREGFIASYGLNGAAAYDKGAKDAAGPTSTGPKIINMQPTN